MASRREGRILAVQALYSWEISSQPVEGLLEFSWRKEPWNPEELLFPSILVRGTLEELEEIDEAIKRHLTCWKFERLQLVDRAILRVATYELIFQKDVPASVAIDEAVEIAKEYSGDDAFRFVNGVLDGIWREVGRSA
ncbi:MAG: transcription antitermination factor NusB [Alkalispirochaetaceae bacterium]